MSKSCRGKCQHSKPEDAREEGRSQEQQQWGLGQGMQGRLGRTFYVTKRGITGKITHPHFHSSTLKYIFKYIWVMFIHRHCPQEEEGRQPRQTNNGSYDYVTILSARTRRSPALYRWPPQVLRIQAATRGLSSVWPINIFSMLIFSGCNSIRYCGSGQHVLL